jgi:hypothetical protein
MTKAQFEAENDLRTLIEAGKIRKSPKRMKAAKAEAKKQKEALKAVEK